MGSRRVAGLAGAAVSGLVLAAAGFAGPAGGARAWAPGGIISTIAGGVGGPGRATTVAIGPCAVDSAGGWLYIGDGSMVRRVSAATDELTTVAGDNAAGPLDGSGAATSGPLSQACGTALDPAGNLVIAAGPQVLVLAARTGTFYGRHMTAGHTYTVAGTAAVSRNGGPDGDGGPATRATLSDAADVAFDQAGNLLIADSGQPMACTGCNPALGSLVRVVAASTGTFYGQKMTAGDIYTVAGDQSRGTAGNGVLATRAWLGPSIESVRPDRAGNLVLADGGEWDYFITQGPTVRVIATVTGTFYGKKMTAGRIYTVAGNGLTGSSGDGGPATAASLDSAGNAIPDSAGNLLIADGTRVRVVAARTGRFYGQEMKTGHIYAIAGTGKGAYSGDGGPAVRAQVSAGTVALDAAGNVLVGGGGRVRAVAVRPGTFYGRKMTAGDIYTVAGNGTSSSGDGGPPLRAEFTGPEGISVDGSGDIAFSAEGTLVDLIPARSGTFFGMRLTGGDLYTVGGEGTSLADGVPARDAGFCMIPHSATLAFDASNLVVADGCNWRVRLIAGRSGRFFGQNMTAGDVYTIAGTGRNGYTGDGGPALKATLNYPTAVGVDHHGNVLIADEVAVRVVAAATGTFYGKKMKAGYIYTVATGGPDAVATDAAGNLIISDGSYRVRLLAVRTGTMYGQKMTAGDVYTIAGSGRIGNSGSGGPAAKARFDYLEGATVDRYGNVIFTDWVSGVVWVLAVTTGTFYGQAMTAGDVYAVAGGGTTLGDGGPAASAQLNYPYAVAVTPAGSVLVTDGADNRLRTISP